MQCCWLAPRFSIRLSALQDLLVDTPSTRQTQRQGDFDNVSASNANFQLNALSRVKNKVTFPGAHKKGVNIQIDASVHCSYHKRRPWNWLDDRTGSRREQSQSLLCWADRGKLKTVVNVHRKTNVTANWWGFLAMQLVKTASGTSSNSGNMLHSNRSTTGVPKMSMLESAVFIL